MKKKTIILGIESSCDETAVAIIKEKIAVKTGNFQEMFVWGALRRPKRPCVISW